MNRVFGIAFAPSDVAAIAGFARSLNAPFDVLQIGGEVIQGSGAASIHLAPDTAPADAIATTAQQLASDATHLVAVSSMASKDVLARLAGLVDCGMITDVVTTLSPTSFKRPVVAGTLIATVEALELPVAITFRPAGYEAVTGQAASSVQAVSLAPSAVAVVQEAKKTGGRPDLTQARIVVSGGRPMKDAATFESVIGGLADALGGAAGATRAAVDSGIAPNELQVGQTGKIVAPDLYIAAGISGSTQHMAGIKDSKFIIAINKDPDAPIFDVADLGLVADLYVALPELKAKLGG